MYTIHIFNDKFTEIIIDIFTDIFTNIFTDTFTYVLTAILTNIFTDIFTCTDREQKQFENIIFQLLLQIIVQCANLTCSRPPWFFSLS